MKAESSKSGLSQLSVDDATSRRMAAIRQVGTSAELLVRKLLLDIGLRYRLRNRELPGSPDIANRRRRWVVFVNGCFWHHHENCKLATVPKRNREFWLVKFKANRARDARNQRRLMEMGFKVTTVWQCELSSLDQVAARLRSELG